MLNVGESVLGEKALKRISWLQKLAKTPEVIQLIEKYPRAAKLLEGSRWLGSSKLDGYWANGLKSGNKARLYSRSGKSFEILFHRSRIERTTGPNDC